MARIELTFRQLAEYDDIANNLLTDPLLHLNVHKVNPHYRTKKVDTAFMARTVRSLASHKNLEQAVQEIIDHEEWVRSYLRRKSSEEIAGFRECVFLLLTFLYCLFDFKYELCCDLCADLCADAAGLLLRHLKRYLGMFLANAGFDVASTSRYSSGKEEVRVCAAKAWHPGDEIRLCSGYVAKLTAEEEKHLTEISQRDFSVMFSTRKESNCLFLGPARFVNHDCNANSKFIPFGMNAVCFKAIREIAPHDEITTFYGRDYFGVNNCECECETCEKYEKGSFLRELLKYY